MSQVYSLPFLDKTSDRCGLFYVAQLDDKVYTIKLIYIKLLFFTSFKVFFVNPLDLKSIELLNIANELLHNSFPVRYDSLIFRFL